MYAPASFNIVIIMALHRVNVQLVVLDTTLSGPQCKTSVGVQITQG